MKTNGRKQKVIKEYIKFFLNRKLKILYDNHGQKGEKK